MAKKLLNVSIIALTIPMMSFAAQKDNPRGSTVARGADNNAIARDSATSVITKNVTSNARQTRSAVVNRPGSTSPSAQSRAAANTANRARSTTARSNAVTNNTSSGKTGGATVARAAKGTPLFTDVSKMGTGYMSCRDAYATCMDQICGYANDTYRRCICSDKFMSFRDTSDKLDSAVALLAQFQDNNLEAVDKTAAEVSAMYSASEGESKIKKDTSASQKLLNNVNSLLAGKTIEKKQTNLNSLGVLDLSGFRTGVDDDIWGGSSSSIFSGDSYESLDDLEGKALFNRAHKQCEELVRDSCGSDATYNLARSAYSIMITQDCNIYETSINATRVKLEETVRTAQKYLREARLEEYRSHNSADVLQCLANVETAMTNTVACGEDYEKCMDYTGKYINTDTGEPIFGPEFFGLNSLIVLDGSADVLKANSAYDKWLDTRKSFATTALDSCRDISNVVWTEFKRSALIKIAQSQDAKIQQVKDTCLNTIKDCYDERTDTLNDMDTTSGQYLGGLAAWSARGTCYEKVLACASLYGDPTGCKYDDKTKKITTVGGKKCGLQALLTYVDTIDAVKVAEGCETGLRKRAHEICDPRVSILDSETIRKCVSAISSKIALKKELNAYKDKFCPVDAYQSDDSNPLSAKSVFNNTALVDQVVDELYEELGLAFMRACEDDKAIGGEWVAEQPLVGELSKEFYKKYLGKTSVTSYSTQQIKALGENNVGWCIMGAEQRECLALGSEASWEVTDGVGECVLTTAWYRNRCQILGGTWNYSTCTINGSVLTMDDIYDYE